MERTGLERATHPLPRLGVPLHHRNEALAAKRLPLPSALCKVSNYCIKTNYKSPTDLAHSNPHKLSKPAARESAPVVHESPRARGPSDAHAHPPSTEKQKYGKPCQYGNRRQPIRRTI